MKKPSIALFAIDSFIVGQLIYAPGTTELWAVRPWDAVDESEQAGLFHKHELGIVLTVVDPVNPNRMQQAFLVTSSGHLGWLYSISAKAVPL